MTTSPPDALSTLAGRYDPKVFELRRHSARVRLAGAGPEPLDAVLDGRTVKLVAADASQRPDALLSADEPTWASIAEDVRGGMAAFRSGRLRVRHDLHLGVGFLAATSASGDAGLRFRHVETAEGEISICEAGSGPPVLLIHGLGATKVSFLPTLNAVADSHRAIAVDLAVARSREPVRLGAQGSGRADPLRTARPRGATTGKAPRARLRTRSPARAPTRDPRRHEAVFGLRRRRRPAAQSGQPEALLLGDRALVDGGEQRQRVAPLG